MTRILTFVGRLAALIRVGLIGGIVLGAVAYPLAAIGGLGAMAGAQAIGDLPASLRIVPSPQTSYLYAADGRTLITTFYEEDRKYTALADTSPWIQKAVVAAEDARFYDHHGVDIKGTIRAFVANNQAGAVSQGASTLTMQYVRNALRDAATSPQEAVDATEQTSARKIREMKLAIELEKRMSKNQILEGYLNVAYFGHRAYGVYAAAQIYFSTLPSQLTLTQAALIAGLVQAPSAYDPAGSDPGAARRRRDYVITRMAQLGYISAADAATAQAMPIQLHLSDPPNDCTAVPAAHNDWGFFCDEFRQWWMAQPAFGATPQDRLSNLRSGGYRIVSSLDPRIQASAMRHITADTKIGDRFAVGDVFLEPGTGLIRSMAVNRTYSLDQRRNPLSTDPAKRAQRIKGNYPNTVNMLLGGGDVAGYQAGSTFKYFTMLAALEKGMTLSTTIYAPQTLATRYLTGPRDASVCPDHVHWCPQNASASMTGAQTIWSGWGKSVNTYWVQMEERVGAAAAVRMAQRLGLTWHNAVDARQASPAHANSWGAFTLGVADTTPLEMAAAYATVAADGVFCAPLPVLSVQRPDGGPLQDGKGRSVAAPQCHRAVSTTVARAAVDAMRCTTGYGAARGSCGGWSTAPGAYGTVGRPFAGKTGTTDSNRSAWFIGFTPQMVGAGFVADPDNPLDVAGAGRHGKPLAAVTQTMHDAMQGKPVRYFQPPPDSIVGHAGHFTVPPGTSTNGRRPTHP
ncbi:MAG TPA: transglycosylase domain-containing protein [Rugosimonospora sp.]|nr:transglycosylase domain-containing protein [Rugosimonospora sp.]